MRNLSPRDFADSKSAYGNVQSCFTRERIKSRSQKTEPETPKRERSPTFLTHLALHDNVSASTQNQALCAMLLLYKEVLKIDMPLRSSFHLKKIPEAPQSPLVPSRSD